jgi:hypothetical protein
MAEPDDADPKHSPLSYATSRALSRSARLPANALPSNMADANMVDRTRPDAR